MNISAIEVDYNSADDIQTRYEVLKKQEPSLRIRDAAAKLGVSEAELVACQIGSANIVALDTDFQAILAEVTKAGEVMALTRNQWCVHERKGVYDNLSYEQHGKMTIGLAVNPDIDLRMFMQHWASCFAVEEDTRSGLRKSIQIFDKAGDAVHKIYWTNKSNEAVFDAIRAQFKAEEQNPNLEVTPYPPAKPDRADSEIDVDALRDTWSKLEDTHDFYPMLMRLQVGRQQAHRLAGETFAYRVPNNSARQILDLARDENCEIMVFVGNKGNIQIHTGPVKKLLEHGKWYNVMDPQFNLHLDETGIAETWVTIKPTVDGDVTAVECFAEDGTLIVTFFGKRKPGIPELELWRKLVAKLEKAA